MESWKLKEKRLITYELRLGVFLRIYPPVPASPVKMEWRQSGPGANDATLMASLHQTPKNLPGPWRRLGRRSKSNVDREGGWVGDFLHKEIPSEAEGSEYTMVESKR